MQFHFVARVAGTMEGELHDPRHSKNFREVKAWDVEPGITGGHEGHSSLLQSQFWLPMMLVR